MGGRKTPADPGGSLREAGPAGRRPRPSSASVTPVLQLLHVLNMVTGTLHTYP